MAALRDVLRDDVLERSDYKRVSVGYPELEAWVGGRIDAEELVYLGHSSVTIPARRLKLIAYDEYDVPVGELARAYLRRVYADAGTLRPRRHAPGWLWQAPLYAQPVRHRPLAYIDIEAAYWQLLSPWRPDDVPLPHGGCVTGDLDWLEADAVAEDRGLRHAVVGSVFSSKVTMYRYGHEQTVYAPSRWANPALRRMCMQTLHACAQGVRRSFGLHAWMTDAAVVDFALSEDVLYYLSNTWGLSAKVKAQGMGAVWSTTQYVVGDKKTQDFVNGNAHVETAQARPHDKLRRVPGEALRAQRLRRLGR